MDALSNIIGTNGIPALVYYIGMTAIAIFTGGWVLNSKIKKIMEDSLKTASDRITKLEAETVRIDVHNKDLLNIVQLVVDLKNDFREGFKGLNARIDALLLATTSN